MLYMPACSVASVVSHSLRPWMVARLLCSWDSLGKNAEVGCYALLQGIFQNQGLKPCLLWLWHHRRILCWATSNLDCLTLRVDSTELPLNTYIIPKIINRLDFSYDVPKFRTRINNGSEKNLGFCFIIRITFKAQFFGNGINCLIS